MELEDFIKRYGDTVAIGDMPDTMPKVIRSPDPFAPGTPFEQSSRNFTNQEVQLQKRLETLNSADTSDYNFIQRKTHSMETNRARNALEKLRKNMEEKPGAFANMRERGGTKEQQDRSAQINKIFQRDYGTDDETESSDRQPGLGKANERPVPEEKITFKDRMAELWEDGSKRNAILSGISETLLETRTGADAYGNRFRDLPKNVNDKMMQAEALDMVKDQAMLDMIKTQAETQAAMDPRQFLSNTQKNARDFASAQGHVIGSKEWNDAYAGAIQEMTMENLLTAPVEGIAAISEMLARNTGMFDEQTVLLFKDVVAQLTSKIQGEPMGKSRSSKKIIQGGTED